MAATSIGVQATIGDISLLLILSFIFVCGFILTYFTAKRDSSIDNMQIVLMLISFFFWSWTIGNPLTILVPPEVVHETLPGLFLLGWSMFMAALPIRTSSGGT